MKQKNRYLNGSTPYCYISTQLNNSNDDEIFDNRPLLEELHYIIGETYKSYTKQCNSDLDADALDKTLGVLYGSIEYWTNSNNVDIWTQIHMEDEDFLYGTVSNTEKPTDGEKGKQKGRNLSKGEWVQVVAAADAAGAALGAGIASAPAAAAASAAAALYFDVE